jgi:hypothetical protein
MEKSFDGVEWLAAMISHMPDKEGVPPLAGVRYYRYCSPALRGLSGGKRKKKTKDTLIPSILKTENFPKEYRKYWARLIRRSMG